MPLLGRLEQPLDPRDVLLIAVRWVHATAAALLVGGGAFCLVVLAPSLAEVATGADKARARISSGFKDLLDVSLVVFVVSGGLLTFERLSSGSATTTYVVVLAVKVIASVLLYRWAFQVQRSRGWDTLEARLFVGAGLLVIFLASALKTIYEGGLRP